MIALLRFLMWVVALGMFAYWKRRHIALWWALNHADLYYFPHERIVSLPGKKWPVSRAVLRETGLWKRVRAKAKVEFTGGKTIEEWIVDRWRRRRRPKVDPMEQRLWDLQLRRQAALQNLHQATWQNQRTHVEYLNPDPSQLRRIRDMR